MILTQLDAILLGPKKADFQSSAPSHLLSYWICPHQEHYIRDHINPGSINSYLSLVISSGKYVQVESENYDEFLKALGVGMLLRKVIQNIIVCII